MRGPKLRWFSLRGPKLREEQIEGKFARRVLDPSKCAPQIFGAIQGVHCFLMETELRGPKYPKKSSKNLIFLFLKVIFVGYCHFRDLYNQYDHFLRKTYFTGRYP